MQKDTKNNAENSANLKSTSQALTAEVQPEPWWVLLHDAGLDCYSEYVVMATDRNEALRKGLEECHIEHEDPEFEDSGYSEVYTLNRSDLEGLLRELNEKADRQRESRDSSSEWRA